MERYLSAVKDFKELRADAETEATRKGIETHLLKYKKFFRQRRSPDDYKSRCRSVVDRRYTQSSWSDFLLAEPITVHEG